MNASRSPGRGPYASRLLADLGADVIKLEALDGDSLRATPRVFHGAQRGKRVINVDLKTPEGRDIGRRLATWADVIQHNLRPGAAERLGLDYATVRSFNPEVIYAYSAGWGATVPWTMFFAKDLAFRFHRHQLWHGSGHQRRR